MSILYATFIRFSKPLDEQTLEKLNRAMWELDHDSPEFGPLGVENFRWAAPTFRLEPILGLIRLAGIDCEGDQWPDLPWEGDRSPNYQAIEEEYVPPNRYKPGRPTLEETARFVAHFRRYRLVPWFTSAGTVV
jgi:hypothetical protein